MQSLDVIAPGEAGFLKGDAKNASDPLIGQVLRHDIPKSDGCVNLFVGPSRPAKTEDLIL